MTNPKRTEKNMSIPPERLAELRRATLIASAGASTRLEGSKLSDKKSESAQIAVRGRYYPKMVLLNYGLFSK